eukprot:gene10400-8347_t
MNLNMNPGRATTLRPRQSTQAVRACTPATRTSAVISSRARVVQPLRAATAEARPSPMGSAAVGGLDPVKARSQEDRRKLVLDESAVFLTSELEKIFSTGDITPYRYAENIRFEDPITSTNNLNGYMLNMKMLNTLFNCKFELYSMKVTGPDEVTARWSMTMDFWLLPWKPTLSFTGDTKYTVDSDTGTILAHIDTWDALQENKYLSMEGLQHVLRMFVNSQLTPDIELQKYKLLKKFNDYEIRKYDSYLVAETSMPTGSGPASGSGFTDIAGYIFGGNSQGESIAMTFSDAATLPTPKDSRVVTKLKEGGFFAAASFPGVPFDGREVVAAERDLGTALQRMALKPRLATSWLGWDENLRLARYNEPFVPPFLRRNEVLIELEEFEWSP